MNLFKAMYSMFVNGDTTSTTTMLDVCECCRRLDGDESLKQVAYCGLCDANLCDTCRASWTRRARAALA